MDQCQKSRARTQVTSHQTQLGGRGQPQSESCVSASDPWLQRAPVLQKGSDGVWGGKGPRAPELDLLHGREAVATRSLCYRVVSLEMVAN